MKTTMKLTIAAAGLIAGIAAPFTADAATYVFSGRGAYAQTEGGNGSLYFYLYASENATKSKSDKATTAGGWLSGSYYDGNECWYGDGYVDNIKFNIKKLSPVTATGSSSITWNEYCSSYASFTENVTFDIELTPLTDQVSSSWGSGHTEYGWNIKVNYNYNETSAPASTGASSITSPAFGTVTPTWGYVGQSKSHEVQVNR